MLSIISSNKRYGKIKAGKGDGVCGSNGPNFQAGSLQSPQRKVSS